MENINMKKNKIILIVALVLSLSANADNDEMRFKAGQQNFKFGNNNTAFLQRNVAYKKNHVNGVGVSSSGTLSKYNYSLWFSNSNAGFDINKDFKTKSGLSGVVGLSAMDGLKTRSVYASAKYGKFVLSASTLVLRAVELKKNGDSSSMIKKNLVAPTSTTINTEPKPPTNTTVNTDKEPIPPTKKTDADPDFDQRDKDVEDAIEKLMQDRYGATFCDNLVANKNLCPNQTRNDKNTNASTSANKASAQTETDSNDETWIKTGVDWSKGAYDDTGNWMAKTEDIKNVANDSCKGVEAISTGGCATATKAVTWYGKALEDGGHWTSQAIDDTGNAGKDAWNWTADATEDALNWVGGIFGATGNQGYGYTGNQALEKLRRSTNIELSYMMSKKTLLSVNGRGTLNAQHLFNKNTHVTIEGNANGYTRLVAKYQF
jgi:hypothetical protein